MIITLCKGAIYPGRKDRKERQQGNKKKITQIWMVLHVRDNIIARSVQYFQS
jgi:hypothetical protein